MNLLPNTIKTLECAPRVVTSSRSQNRGSLKKNYRRAKSLILSLHHRVEGPETLLFPALFLVAAVFHGTNGSLANAAWDLLFAVLMSAAQFLARVQQRESGDFLIWLDHNRERLQCDIAFYKGRRVTPLTEVTQFRACLSPLTTTVKLTSRYLIHGQDNLLGMGLAYSLVTLLLGWWKLPWGPVHTFLTLLTNLLGGHKHTVAELLAELDKAQLPAGNTSDSQSCRSFLPPENYRRTGSYTSSERS
ncbi:hypothetical protein HYR54_15670 [Candidatus Acetothermia bacterium]|nr:hypothetical protein [Candidatus Acetothermia bacterium]